MKRSVLLLLAAATMALAAAAPRINISRIEPAYWFAGLRHTSLQLMVYGPGIADARVSTRSAGVTVDSVVSPGSPNYLLVYLNVGQAQPGTVQLRFERGGKSKTVDYELRRRARAGNDYAGFDCSDVLYMLMPDRFANGDPSNDQLPGLRPYRVDRTMPSLRHGGDLAGLRQHLDYFNELGVTALWLTPVLENNWPDDERGVNSSYHGYATTDYYRVDPRYGTNQDYTDFVADAHRHGLKVVMDMIFNHCSDYHPWVKDMPSPDWFNIPDNIDRFHQQTSYKLTPVLDPYASQVDRYETVEGWFVSSMPDLNQHNVHVMNYLIQNSIWWIETTGIDGIRMDTYPYAYADAMARWMRTLDEEYPHLNVVGETWVQRPAYTATWQRGSRLRTADQQDSYLKTVMDFTLQENLDSAKHEETDGWWRGYNRVYNGLCYDYLYEDPSHVMAFIDNHDTDRFLADGQDAPALKQALALLLTMPRIPQLYYGTEILMNGTKRVTDGNVRRDFPGGFPGDTRNCFTAQGRTAAQNDMFTWLSRVLHWRQGNEVVTRGRTTQFIPHDGVYVLARRLGNRSVVTVINGTTQPRQLPLERYREVLGNATQALDVPTATAVSLAGTALSLPPRGVFLLDIAL